MTGSVRRRGAARSIGAVGLVCALIMGCARAEATGSISTEPASAAAGSAGASAPSPTPTGPPSGLIALPDGRHLDITCVGSGGPIVVLDAGLGNTSEVWIPVALRVKSFATVCRYDRAGLGASDPRPEPHGAVSAVSDLHALLTAAGLPPPYVMVGASFGGLDAQLFARTYPAEVAGVVLVDGIHPKWNAELEALLTPDQVAARHAIPNGEPISNDDLRASDAAVLAAPPFPPVRLDVLSHDLPFPGDADWPTEQVESLWTRLQIDLAAMSPDSVRITATGAGHRIHTDQPILVSDAIHAIVDPTLWPPKAPTAGTAFGAGAEPVAPGSIPGTLAYSGGDGLRIAKVDGSGSRLILPDDGARIGEPSLDASGRHVAFTRGMAQPPASGPQPEPQVDVYVMDTWGGEPRPIAKDGSMPVFSPDGGLVAFSARGHTYLVRPDGTGLRDVGEGGCAVWSPDSTRIAMCTPQDSVFVLRVSDLTRVPIPTGAGPNDPAAWSPDGSTLALYSSRDGDGEIYLIGIDGTNERRLTTGPGNQAAQVWTSAGLLVTSSLPDADASDWFVVDPVTGTPRVLPWLHGVPNPIGYSPAE
jgi:pimeloyl-ACP methyl ester carboxylesterase